MPDRIASRLAEELDALSPLRPLAAQARYQGPARAVRVGGLALAGAAAALLVTALSGVATFATGSPNPQVWTVELAAGLHQLQDPDRAPARPPSPQSSPPGQAPVAVPAPAATVAAPESHPTRDPEEKHSPTPRDVRPSSKPSESPRPDSTPSGGQDDHRASPSPSPKPTTSIPLGVVNAMARPASAAHNLETEVSL